jgi:2-polyprenyl-3-methyl-5-hydroxy-6-metoxy-1,4-benzoquinol methylase
MSEHLHLTLTDEPLSALTPSLREALQTYAQLRLTVPYSPQECELFEGESYTPRAWNTPCRYRSLRAWLELAEVLEARLSLEEVSPQAERLTFTLSAREGNEQGGWHERALPSGHSEKYGVESTYARVSKLEEPIIARDLERALWLARPQGLKKALAVGCNQGDELLPLLEALRASPQGVGEAQLIGVDHSASAIEEARARHQAQALCFEVANANELSAERYGELDLLMALNILHSPSLDGHTLFKSWVKGLLKPQASVIVGLPNCRYQGSELRYGAITPHSGGQDLAQLLTEAQFYLRYLRQQGFNTFVVGRYQLLVVGRRGR